MPDQRPDPDALLEKVQREEEEQRRGRLKIFFGGCAGVGKTYAMLVAAREQHDKGVDVVVGIAETHGRAETAVLLDGLEVLPRRQVPYRGRQLSEFDLDAALARRPALLLVDELAHSNVAGSAPPQALAGRGGTARRRHRRLYDLECPAPGEPERHRRADHRGAGVGDGAGPGLRRGHGGGPGGPAPGRAAAAPQGGQGLSPRSGGAGGAGVLPPGQPVGVAGAGPAAHRRPGGRPDARLSGGSVHHPGLAGQGAADGVRRPGSGCGSAGAQRRPPGGQPARRLAGGLCGDAQVAAPVRRAPRPDHEDPQAGPGVGGGDRLPVRDRAGPDPAGLCPRAQRLQAGHRPVESQPAATAAAAQPHRPARRPARHGCLHRRPPARRGRDRDPADGFRTWGGSGKAPGAWATSGRRRPARRPPWWPPGCSTCSTWPTSSCCTCWGWCW